jgi:hypothetical protein
MVMQLLQTIQKRLATAAPPTWQPMQIDNQQVNRKDIHEVCGDRGKPIFEAIPIRHFITPILHLTIGKGNNVLDNYIAKLQANAKGYADE